MGRIGQRERTRSHPYIFETRHTDASGERRDHARRSFRKRRSRDWVSAPHRAGATAPSGGATACGSEGGRRESE